MAQIKIRFSVFCCFDMAALFIIGSATVKMIKKGKLPVKEHTIAAKADQADIELVSTVYISQPDPNAMPVKNHILSATVTDFIYLN